MLRRPTGRVRVHPTVSRILRIAFALAAVALAGYGLAARWDEARAALDHLSWGGVVGAMAAALAGLACLPLAWRSLLADLGSPLPVPVAMRILFLAQLGKYVPGSVWQFAAAMELAREHEVPRRRSASASVLAIAITTTVGLVVAAATLPLASGGAARQFWWALALAPALLVALHPRVVNPCLDRALRALRRPALERSIGLAGTARTVGWTMLAWAFFGAHAVLLVTGAGAWGAAVVPVAAGAYALAWGVGFLVVVAPAGVGPREAALVAALAPVLAPGSALVVAVMSRVVMTVGDLALAGVAVLLARGDRNPRRVG